MTQTAAAIGGGNVIVQVQGDGNSIVAGLPHLALTQHGGLTRRINTDAHTRSPREIDILRAYTRSIEIVGREIEIGALHAWLGTLEPIAVHVMTGGAGYGKTRLALELVDEMALKGWRTGFLTAAELTRFRGQQDLANWGWNHPVLAVVDDAAASAGELHCWLKELSANPVWDDPEAGRTRPLRLLLLERQAKPGRGWWVQTFGRGDDAALLEKMLDPSAPLPLSPISLPQQRRAILVSTLARLGATVRPPAPGESENFDRRLSELTWGGVPLLLMMSAATAAHEGFGHVLALGSDVLAFNIAETERSRVRNVVMSSGVPASLAPLVDHLIAVATLRQGLSYQAAVDVIEQESAATGYHLPMGPAALRDGLAEALPDGAGGIAPVTPDLIGGALLLSVWDHDDAVALHAIDRSYQAEPLEVAASIIRTCTDYVIRERRRPLEWLKRIRTHNAHELNALIGLSDAIPERTVELREVAVELCTAIVAQFRDHAGDAQKPQRIAALATALSNYSNRLSDVGRRTDALDAIREATDLFRGLVNASPEAYRPDLAMCLDNLSIHLSRVEERQEALAASQQATAIYRSLAASNRSRFLPDVAKSLSNLSNRLSEMGRNNDALKAIDEATSIFRQLDDAVPGVYRHDLAGFLSNLSSALSATGLTEEALAANREATDIYRDLAAARPDAFLDDLAMSLNNLSNRLSKLRRHEEAVSAITEAVAIRRQLADAQPGPFRPYLAMYLKNLSDRLSAVERREEALAAIDESVAIRRDLAAGSPGLFREDLAKSLYRRSSHLSAVGHHEEALAAIEEAVATLREPFLSTPAAFAELMHRMIRSYRARCRDAARHPDVSWLAPIDEALLRLKNDCSTTESARNRNE